LRSRSDRHGTGVGSIDNNRCGLDGKVISVDTVGDSRVGDTVGSSGDGEWSSWGDGVSNSPLTDGTISSVGTSVSLSESRGGSVGNGVESWWGSGIALARGEGVVGLVKVSNGHDELTTHDIELVLTHQGGGRVLGLGGTDSETELVVRDERHPLEELAGVLSKRL